MRKVKYKEISESDLESLAMILTDNGHAEDLLIEFRTFDLVKKEVVIKIKPELQ